MKKNIKLKIRLFESGINQVELAQKTGIPEAYISMSINGRFLLSQSQKKMISEVLNCSVDEIFPEENFHG